MGDELKFVPFDCVIDTAFWHGLAKQKLEDFKLDEGPFPITAEFTCGTALDLSPRINLDLESLQTGVACASSHSNLFRIEGSVITLNNLNQFKCLDKQAYIDEFGLKRLSAAITALGKLPEKPNALLPFLLLTHCDLKHHKFYFWFACPVPVSVHKPECLSLCLITEALTCNQVQAFASSYDRWRENCADIYFCARVTDQIQILNLCEYDASKSTDFLGFCDSSSDPHFPGWPLRTLLFAVATTLKFQQLIKVICFRDRYFNRERTISHSIVMSIQLEPENISNELKFVGWEKWKGKLQPRMVNLSSTMDPVKLASSAVNLNLKLMLWRMLPNLDLATIHRTRCLVLGCGTLGCNVARQLLAWGFRSLTLVDNATVSYSNPVRQTLYTFEDAKVCAKKASAAAAALRKIFPSVDVKDVDLTIPMPGHPVSPLIVSAGSPPAPQVIAAEEACQLLDELIRTHDVLFLLLDTREARWLPTLLATYYDKVAITVALGFDSYLVMRHGLPGINGRSPSLTSDGDCIASDEVHGCRLGCYFCNDVVGPSNSTQDRSLDQQCTVARPGLSMIASALAVELCVGLLHHPKRGGAPARMHQSRDAQTRWTNQNETFAFLPHQIRGFLSQFSEVLPCTTAFRCCSACSQPVLDAYANDRFAFLLRVFDDAKYLEQISGLTDLQLETMGRDMILLSDEDESDS